MSKDTKAAEDIFPTNRNETLAGEQTLPTTPDVKLWVPNPPPEKIDWNTRINKDKCILIDNGSKKTEFVLLSELQRLGDERGIEYSKITSTHYNAEYRAAAVAIEIKFKDGEIACGFGDCTPDNSDDSFSYFPAAMAESRARARALRFGLKINMCSFEEVAKKVLQPGTAKITDNQIAVIETIVKKNKIDLASLLSKGTRKVNEISELTSEEGSKLIKSLNTTYNANRS